MKKLLAFVLMMSLIMVVFPTYALAGGAAATSSNSRIIGNINNNKYQIVISGILYQIPENTTLSIGSHDNGTTSYVYIAQKSLNCVRSRYSLYYSELVEDGDYGQNTANAASAFQQWWNDNRTYFDGSIIQVNGVVSNPVWARFSILCM